MTENEREIVRRITDVLEKMASGRKPSRIEYTETDAPDDSTLMELEAKVVELNNLYAESYRFILDLARGKLNGDPPPHNNFVTPFKQLQSELRHLTWQIEQIAAGDLDQMVYFSGDFSRAINQMIDDLREREELRQQLADSNHAKDKLFSIIAHDLRNPFNAIVGFSEMMVQMVNMASPADLKQFAEMIHTSAKQTYNLLLNLLEWSRVQTGRIDVKPMEGDLALLIRTNVNISSITAEPKQIQIYYDGGDSYPVTTDAAIFNTILRNLISNAIKYTPERGEIRISVDTNNRFYYISVHDTGMGMSEEDVQKLFRLDVIHTTNGTNQEKGTGLGLILCKEFVTMLGGDIYVESEKGKGSTFTFSIPK
ncbi:MAG: HAMP domain-containing histidine kinase [Prevotellaceae bacterium]|jgi:signal transduction histidine kinase|nr:HAMP domain-containing histidine kinase [Prevotellaceae bacterium]